MSSITPNMLLIVPDVSITPGPEWAQDINDSLGLIDSHDHTTDGGVKVPTGGLNINADLSFNDFSATSLVSTIYSSQVTSPLTNTSVYVTSGELAYRDSLGQEVIITSNGSIVGAAGNISGLVSPASASFSSITDSFTFNYDTSKPGKLNISDINLYEFGNATANPITLKSPAAVSTPYSWIFPADLPASDRPLVISASGQIKYTDSVNSVGMVPIGAVIPVMSNLPGSYNCVATTVADPATGYVNCLGQTLTDPLSPLNGQVIPDISDSRYIRGYITSLTTGGSNTHAHVYAHSHQWMNVEQFGGAGYSLISPDRTTANIPLSSTPPYGAVFIQTANDADAGVNKNVVQMSYTGLAARPYYTSGVVDASGGGTGATATTETASTEPQYINAFYLMRVY